MDNLKKAVSTVIVSVLIIVSIHRVSDFLQLKDSDNRYSSYLTEDASIDVLFLGSSHVRHGFFPMELWNDYGISSFNLAANGSTISVSYWTLVNALDYQEIKLVVMDVFDMWPGRICSDTWGQVHIALDFFPISVNKCRMVKDLFDDPELTDAKGVNLHEKRWEILWDIGEYHTRWTNLVKDDFATQSELEKNSAIWKGAAPLIQVVDRNKMVYQESVDGLEYDEISREYLLRMIRLCTEENIELVLINTGYDCNAEAKIFADSVYDIAAQFDIPYLDFTQKEIINFNTDLQTTGHNTHVNFSGAEKFTSYIGKYLSENYSLIDHRNDEAYSSWRMDYQLYTDSKETYLTTQSDLTYYLMFLADNDYQIVIEIREPSILYENRNQAMLENLGVDYSKIRSDCNLIMIDNGTREVVYQCMNEASADTYIGRLCTRNNEDAAVYEKCANENEGRMRISVINRNTGEMVDSRVFQ